MSDTCIKCDECTKACPLIVVTKQEHLWRIYFGEHLDLWNCSSCFRCEESCPVNLSVRDELFKKRRSLQKSAYPLKYLQYFQNILQHGIVFVIDDETSNEKRTSLGLHPINFKKLKTEMKKFLAEAE